MKQPTDLGMNRTGVDMSPVDVQELLAGVRAIPPSSGEDEGTLAAFRASYLEEADPIGTVPVPGTFTGLAQSTMQKLTGKKPEVLIDKLAERLAFERTGTRLYDALLSKCDIRADEAGSLPLDQLRHFREEEARHFGLVWDVMRSLGADPTAQTPAADIDAVASMGLVQVLTDPRTSVAQSLHAIHIAELADYDGWELLIRLVDELGMAEIAGQFRQAYGQEDEHLREIRQLMTQSVLGEAGVR